MLPRDYANQNCSIARTLEILGDRWTFLVVRNALVGYTRFGDFLERLGIARDVLADRLARLAEEGILERVQYEERPPRYEYRITEKGLDLWPILVAMVEWGDRYYSPNGAPRVMVHEGCGGRVVQQLVCEEGHPEVKPAEITTRPGPGAGKHPAVAAK